MRVLTTLGITKPRDDRARYAFPGHATVSSRVVLALRAFHSLRQQIMREVAPVLPWSKGPYALKIALRQLRRVVVLEHSGCAQSHALLITGDGSPRVVALFSP